MQRAIEAGADGVEIHGANAIAAGIGPDRTAIRLSPGTTLWGIDEGPEGPALYRHLVAELNRLQLAYLHVMHQVDDALLAGIRRLWTGALISNRPGRPREQIGADIASGLADLESFGQMVLANPDFVDRLKVGAPMNPADPGSFFGGSGLTSSDRLHVIARSFVLVHSLSHAFSWRQQRRGRSANDHRHRHL